MAQFREEDAIEIDPPIPLPRKQSNQPLRFNLDDPLDEPTDVSTSVAPQPAITRPTKRRKTRKETEAGTSRQPERNVHEEIEHDDPNIGGQEETPQMRRIEKQAVQPAGHTKLHREQLHTPPNPWLTPSRQSWNHNKRSSTGKWSCKKRTWK